MLSVGSLHPSEHHHSQDWWPFSKDKVGRVHQDYYYSHHKRRCNSDFTWLIITLQFEILNKKEEGKTVIVSNIFHLNTTSLLPFGNKQSNGHQILQ